MTVAFKNTNVTRCRIEPALSIVSDDQWKNNSPSLRTKVKKRHFCATKVETTMHMRSLTLRLREERLRIFVEYQEPHVLGDKTYFTLNPRRLAGKCARGSNGGI